MNRIGLAILILVAMAGPLRADQSPAIVWLPGNPPGGIGAHCGGGTLGYLNTGGQAITCVSNVWTVIAATIGPAQGGCGTSLAATGPGYLRQDSTGANCTVIDYVPVSKLGSAQANLFVNNGAWNIDFTGTGWWSFPKVGIGSTFTNGAPGVGTDDNFTEVGNATIYDPSTLGSELGTSDTSCTNWTLSSGWSCAGGMISHTSGTTTAEFVPPSAWFTAGNFVRLVFTIQFASAGYVTPTVGGITLTNTSAITHNATYTYDVATTTTGHLVFTPTTNFDGAIGVTQGAGGLSLKQITGGNLHVAGTATVDGDATFNNNVTIPPTLLGKYTVGTPGAGQTALPTASSYANYLATVVDCETTAACSTGGGTVVALLRSNGSAWSLYAGAGSTGATGAIDVANGSGGWTDSGCTGGSGAITCTPSGGAAGIVDMPQGTAVAAGTNSVGFQAPASVTTPYHITLPGAPAAGYVKRTNATPSVESVAAIPAGDLPATPLYIAATTHTMTAPREYFFCTTATACSVTLPTPAAGYEFCVRSDNNVSTAITLAGITNVYYEKPDRTGWGTKSAALVSTGAAVTNQVCVVGYDSTHYAIMSSTGF